MLIIGVDACLYFLIHNDAGILTGGVRQQLSGAGYRFLGFSVDMVNVQFRARR